MKNRFGYSQRMLEDLKASQRSPILKKAWSGTQKFFRSILEKVQSTATAERNHRDQAKIQKMRRKVDKPKRHIHIWPPHVGKKANTATTQSVSDSSSNFNHLHFGKGSSKKKRKWLGITSGALVVILMLAIGGGFVSHYHTRELADAHQRELSKKARAKHVSFIVETKPRSIIYANNQKAGIADKKGKFHFRDLAVGTKLYAAFGKTKTSQLVITKGDKNAKVQLRYDSLKPKDAQVKLNQIYRCVTNLINHNDQMSGNHSLDDFYVGSNDNKAYRAMYRWSKAQNNLIDVKPNKSNKAAMKAGTLEDIHFSKHVQSTHLNPDNTVTVRFQVKNDFARSKQDHVETFNWIAKFKKDHGYWRIITAKSAARPIKSFNL